MSQLVTGEAVAVDLRVARLGSRTAAALIDTVIQIGLLIAGIVLFGQIGPALDPAVAVTLLILSLVADFLVYPVAFETLWGGRTPGKAAMGLRVVRDDGGPARFRHALLRGLIGLFVERPPSPFFFVAVIASLASERGKRLGDVAAGTIVLQERVPTRAPSVIAMPPQLAEWASALDLSALPSDLALAVREFLGRAAALRPAAREQIGRQLYAAVSAVVTPPPPPGTPGWAYLAAVLAERRRRDEQRLRAGAAGTAGWGGTPPPGTPSPWGSDGPVGAPSPWPGSAPATGAGPVVGPPPQDPGPPPPVPTTGPFTPPA
ncbi:MAG TPA: RDD family protein [Mycobacteriales bacterium]|nr:RDD family protein [Mycobacteriales bacterium]